MHSTTTADPLWFRRLIGGSQKRTKLSRCLYECLYGSEHSSATHTCSNLTSTPHPPTASGLSGLQLGQHVIRFIWSGPSRFGPVKVSPATSLYQKLACVCYCSIDLFRELSFTTVVVVSKILGLLTPLHSGLACSIQHHQSSSSRSNLLLLLLLLPVV